jgi:hypothetical protein
MTERLRFLPKPQPGDINMRLNCTGHSKAILVAAVALVALLVVPSLAHALKLPITGGTSLIISSNTTVPIYPIPTVAGSATVVTYIGVGSTPARLTLPTGVIGMPFTYRVSTAIPTPPYITVTTNFSHYGPVVSPAVFKAGPKPTRPAAFNFCPGFVGNPACLTANQGTKPGIVKYTPGVKQFGGTMRTFTTGTGEFTIYLGYTAPTIAHFPLTQPGGGLTGALGRTYKNTIQGTTYSAAVTTGAVMANRRIQQPGNFAYSIPGATFTYTGFPFTTGMVTVSVLHAPPTYPNSIFTTTGSDTRTLGGRGNITMVAGGLSHTLINSLANRHFFTITLLPEPVLLLQLASGLLGLALLDKRRRRANR